MNTRETRAEIPFEPIALTFPKHSLCCTSCPYNGRTDKEAAWAHLTCREYVRDIRDDGQSYIRLGGLLAPDEFLDEHAAKFENAENVSEEGDYLTNLKPDLEEAIRKLIYSISGMGIEDCIIFHALLNGCTLQQAANILGISKQAVWKRTQQENSALRLSQFFKRRDEDGKMNVSDWGEGLRVEIAERKSLKEKTLESLRSIELGTVSDIARFLGIEQSYFNTMMCNKNELEMGEWRITRKGDGFLIERISGGTMVVLNTEHAEAIENTTEQTQKTENRETAA